MTIHAIAKMSPVDRDPVATWITPGAPQGAGRVQEPPAVAARPTCRPPPTHSSAPLCRQRLVRAPRGGARRPQNGTAPQAFCSATSGHTHPSARDAGAQGLHSSPRSCGLCPRPPGTASLPATRRRGDARSGVVCCVRMGACTRAAVGVARRWSSPRPARPTRWSQPGVRGDASPPGSPFLSVRTSETPWRGAGWL
jgi:hypothetical protein